MDLTEPLHDVRVTVHGAPWADARIKNIVNQLERLGVHKLNTQTKQSILHHVLGSQFPYHETTEDFKYLCSEVIERITGRPAIIEHSQSHMSDLLLQLCVQLQKHVPIRTCGHRMRKTAVVHNSHVIVVSMPISRTDDDDYDPKDSLSYNEE